MLKLQGDDCYYLATSHSATIDYRIMHLFRCDRMVAWSRNTVTNDTLTGLPMAAAEPTLIENIWLMWERSRRQFADQTAHLNLEVPLIATGAPVQPNDYIDGKIVKRVAYALGVQILVIQE